MARWKLATPHYLNVTELIEWEYQEVDRKTNRPVRRKFAVPRYLNPLDPSDWTNRWGGGDSADGEVIVCLPGQGHSTDIEFLGDPTPDMIPVDDEAKALSASFEATWRYKPDTALPGDYSQSLVDAFQSEMAEVTSKPVEIPGLVDLVAAIASQTKQQGELIAHLASTSPASGQSPLRR